MILHKYPICKNSVNRAKFCLELALAISPELGSGASNGGLACLLDLGLEDDLVAFSPHLSDNGLAGNDDTSEADLDVLEGTEFLIDGLSGNAKGAKAVENGGLETTDLGKGRVDVERAMNVSYDHNVQW